MIIIRIIASWIAEFERSAFIQFLARFVDPYLKLFRKFIPPIGGVLDLSPILAFIVLQVLEFIILSIL
jgi:YggT family protein